MEIRRAIRKDCLHQEKGDGGLDKSLVSGGGVKWSDSGYIRGRAP